MGGIFWSIVIVLLGWADFSTVRFLVIDRKGPVWWLALLMLLLAGGLAGIWCGFYLEYQPTENLRVYRFPLLVVVWKRENGDWVDYVSHLGVIICYLDFLIVTLFSVLPLSIVCAIQRYWRRRKQTA
jgi:hypothetical protein